MPRKQHLNETQRNLLQETVNNFNDEIIEAYSQGKIDVNEVKVLNALECIIEGKEKFMGTTESPKEFFKSTVRDLIYRDDKILIRLGLNLDQYFQFALGRLNDFKFETIGAPLTENHRKEIAAIIKNSLRQTIKDTVGSRKRKAIAAQRTLKSSVITRFQEKALFKVPPNKRAKKTPSCEQVGRSGPTLRCR